MPLDPAVIHVWLWNLDASQAGGADDRALLSPTERMRAERTIVPQAARRFVAGRALLRRTVAEICGCPPDRLDLAAGASGKPFVVGGPHFNLSHSGATALFAVAAFPVGVDVERIRPIEEGVAALVLSGGELAELSRANDREAAFFRAWTRKEAVVKAKGASLAEMRSVVVAVGAAASLAAHPGWQMVDLAAPAGHVAALAAPRDGWRVCQHGF